jgi:hypothetical protein
VVTLSGIGAENGDGVLQTRKLTGLPTCKKLVVISEASWTTRSLKGTQAPSCIPQVRTGGVQLSGKACELGDVVLCQGLCTFIAGCTG